MTRTPPHPTHALQHHPATPPGLPLEVSVAVGWTAEGLQLVYAIAGNISALRVPAATKPGPADGLWQHTCLEAFVSASGDASYREFNVSPSGQWAAYRFAGERQRDTSAAPDLPAPATQLAVTPTLLSLDVRLPLTALPSPAPHLEMALCAVVEELDGRLSYWALQHPKASPDFHHPAGRMLCLALPQN